MLRNQKQCFFGKHDLSLGEFRLRFFFHKPKTWTKPRVIGLGSNDGKRKHEKIETELLKSKILNFKLRLKK
jgi:hypothetical protein